MENTDSPLKKRICYNYFHVPGESEIAQFRFNNAENISRGLESIGNRVITPTYAFQSADDARDFLNQKNIKILKSRMTRPFYLTEISLLAGWFSACESFVESEYEYLILFEDDMWVNQDDNAANTMIESILDENLPPDADFINFYTTEGCLPYYKEEYRVNDLLCTPYNLVCCGMILMTKNAAKKLLEKYRVGISAAIDLELFGGHSFGQVIYSLRPEVQAGVFSMWSRNWVGSTIDPEHGKFEAVFFDEE